MNSIARSSLRELRRAQHGVVLDNREEHQRVEKSSKRLRLSEIQNGKRIKRWL